ncbi:hypothetical protein [Streptomyces spirodelae]|uniref:hypothetical protein n=1 Tax=Streptomyces spirodelae TaxID=2812904 RepID=UPI0027DC657D|nr:hypothetical protein [Streptomyces spirodelae]
MIAGLLFCAFAFFAVAQAGTVRNSGQTAADAAALAAAMDDRDELFDGFLEAVDDDDAWQDWLDGAGTLTGDGCGQAERFAGRNRSDVLSCEQTARNGDSAYTVRIRTRFDTGKSIIPGASDKKATATATAVIKPRCDFDPEADTEEIELNCDGDEITVDPDEVDPDGEEPDLKPADLFSVVLAD